ncbi:MAG: hypothetical protein K6G17_03605 [Oscillospiraceae bacterium]|nr:hypothetical protein [Oscillospiraceae bacterium]
MKRTISLVFIALFLLISLLPSAGIAVFGASGEAANEVLSPKPQLKTDDGSLNARVLTQFSDYFADRFALRQSLLTAWAKLNASVFQTSVEEQVVLGTDGWLYYAKTLDDYLGRGLSDGELRLAARNLLLMQEYAESRGTAFVFTIAPNKNSLYPEHMPAFAERDRSLSNAERFIPMLERSGVNYADLFGAFQNREVLYFRTDSHWNARGAALAADALLAAFGRDSDYFNGPFSETTPHPGDLYEMLFPRGEEREEDCVYSPGFRFETERDPNGGNALTIRSYNEEAEGTLLCYRDSFGAALYPYLADQFEQALFSRSDVYDLCALESERIDAVLIELVERNIPWLLEKAAVFPAAARETGAAAETGEAVALTKTDGAGEGKGLVSYTGSLPLFDPSDCGGVYLACEGRWYECCVVRLDDGSYGFSAWLDAGLAVPERLILSRSGGTCAYTLTDAAVG